MISFNERSASYVSEYNMEKDVFYLRAKNPVKRYFEILSILKTHGADVIWTWGGMEASYGIFLGMQRRIVHINGSIRHGIVKMNRHQLWRMLILHLSRNIVANSSAGLKANRLKRGSVMYNGIDDGFLSPPQLDRLAVRSGLGIDKDILLAISVANYVPYKDYTTVLSALRILKEEGIRFHYLAVGDGPQREYLENLVSSYQLNEEVTLTGMREDVKELLFASDLFIHSSQGEGCSNAILESMASGLPVIASDTGGTKEIVNDSNGRLFDYQDVDQVLTCIKELAMDTGLRNKLGENSKRRIENEFGTGRMISQYQQILSESR